MSPIILGGDLNTDLNVPADRLLYTAITIRGFTDTYAARNNCIACCPGAGCTYAVDGNPLANAVLTTLGLN